MVPIYHITSAVQAAAARESGQYIPEGFAREGFIHCSYRHQVSGVVSRLFQERTDLVLLEIDPSKLDCAMINENLEGGSELFPHIYGCLPMSAVVRVLEFPFQ